MRHREVSREFYGVGRAGSFREFRTLGDFLSSVSGNLADPVQSSAREKNVVASTVIGQQRLNWSESSITIFSIKLFNN